MISSSTSILIQLPFEIQLNIYSQAVHCEEMIHLGFRPLDFSKPDSIIGNVEKKAFINLLASCKPMREIVLHDQTFFKINRFWDYSFLDLYASLPPIPLASTLAIRDLTVRMYGVYFTSVHQLRDVDLSAIRELSNNLTLKLVSLTLDLVEPFKQALPPSRYALRVLRSQSPQGEAILNDARIQELVAIKGWKDISLGYNDRCVRDCLSVWYKRPGTDQERKDLLVSFAKGDAEIKRSMKAGP